MTEKELKEVLRDVPGADEAARAAAHAHWARLAKPLGGLGQTQFVAADVRDARSVARAATGSDAVVNLVGSFADMAAAQNIQYGQANQQDMLRRSQELNQRAKSDTNAATERMRRILQEKRDGQRGLSKDFMNRQGSGNGAGRQ